jgi:hypothetical protein
VKGDGPLRGRRAGNGGAGGQLWLPVHW